MAAKIAGRVAALSESATLKIDAKAKQMKADGIDVVNFTAGEPDFDTPVHIKDAAKKALDAGKTKYTPSAGILELRQAICEKLDKENGLQYKPGQILVSIGAKHSLFNIILTIIERGDQVIIPAPYWVSYYEMVQAAEGVPVVVQTTAEADFKITPEQLKAVCTPRTAAIILCSPSNPTGSVYTQDELKALANVIIEKDLVCISDEIYEKLLYDGRKHASIATLPGMKERTLVVNGFSKAYSMTGWRLGYAAGPANIIAAMNTLQSHSTSGATTFAQWGALEALKAPQDDVEKMRVAFDERRNYLVERLNKIPGVKCNMPGGAFYAFPDMSAYHGKTTPDGKVITGSMELTEYLLEEAKCSAVPGVAFGAEAHQRFSYALSKDSIKKGIDRIEEALKKLK